MINKNREYQRNYYLTHIKERKEYKRKYYIDNVEKEKERQGKYHQKNRGKIREDSKKYYLAHIEEYKERGKKYYQKNKEKMRGYSREYLAKEKIETPWVPHFRSAKGRCDNPNTKCYRNYGGRGIKFLLTMNDVRTLYLRDNARGLEKPSIDRMDNNGNYVFTNCRFIEQSENTRHSIMTYNGK